MKILEMLTYAGKFKSQNIFAERVISELEFAYKLLELNKDYKNTVEKAMQVLYTELNNKGYVNKEIMDKVEKILAPISKLAKDFTIICVGHAHIDMNWMWGYHETVAATLDTFRTVLDLMEEYPEFTFAQSQASVYKIVENYHPKMLEKIKEKIREGRWEITASTWVEADKNMPNTESLVRHILYTKKYLSNLFGIDKDTLVIDFEPDTFGHSKFVPTILEAGGVKYYYHCRGNDKEVVYRWISPSSSEVIVYREPFWYNGSPTSEMALYAIDFYKMYGSKYTLKVYGIGNHGGGPTRKDIENIIRMSNYPIYPKIKFGTYKEFFEKLEEIKDKLPVITEELNFIFDGCYTTQSRIKMANKIAEATVEETEKFSVFSSAISDYKYPSEKFRKAWENILFSHFHDIIPGSGVTETREYALGLFQETMATLLSQKKIALEEIVLNIDTQSIVQTKEDRFSTSEGAGVAFKSEDYRISQDSRGRGNKRVYHLFNPSPKERREIVEIFLWDWEGDLDRLIIRNADGKEVEHQFVEKQFRDYWGHKYIKILIEAIVPGFGYTTYIIDEKPEKDLTIEFPKDPRVQKPSEYVLENEKLRAVFDTSTAKLISIYDKENGIEFIDSKRGGAHFRLIHEDINSKACEMLEQANAWVIGRYLEIIDIHRNVKIRKGTSGTLRNSIIFEFEFGNSSSISVEVILDKDSDMLKFVSNIDFKEFADLRKDIVPQLSFYIPLNFNCNNYVFDVPAGIVERGEYNLDVPGLTFGCAKATDRMLALFSKTKYGYRVKDNTISLTLLRASQSPDPYPEIGKHKTEFAIFVSGISVDNHSLGELSYNYNHELSVMSNSIHKGNLPLTMKFADIKTNSSMISCIKRAENRENSLVVRLYEVNGKTDEVSIEFHDLKPSDAYSVDVNEEKILKHDVLINENRIRFEMKPYELKTVMIDLAQ